MRRFFIFLLTALIAVNAGCAKNEPPADPEELERAVERAQELEQSRLYADQTRQNASVVENMVQNSLPPIGEVTKTAAVFYKALDGQPMLYAAIEYENKGETPIIVDSCHVKFTFEGGSREVDFVPMLNKSDVIFPGEKGSLAVWENAGGDIKGEVSAEASINCSEASLSAMRPLEVSDLYIADNYPRFSTVSGTLKNTSDYDYALSVVYISFYDATGDLAAVWHFTKNLAIPAGESRNFVVHMQMLPLKSIAARTVKMVGRGVGIN